jgi:hypothetical protein
MRIVKVESEVQKYYEIVKELQGQSNINAELGKKVYALEISKRNEEEVGKKCDQLEDEVRLIQSENKQLAE